MSIEPIVGAVSIQPFDLVTDFCPDCRKPKSLRLFTGPSDCPTCDEVRSRHRCNGRPASAWDINPEGTWTCPECGTVWGVEVEWTEDRHWMQVSPAVREVPHTRRSSCHTTPTGVMVHVQPDCRCDSKRPWRNW